MFASMFLSHTFKRMGLRQRLRMLESSAFLERMVWQKEEKELRR